MNFVDLIYTVLISLYISLAIVTLVNNRDLKLKRFTYALNILSIVGWAIAMVLFQHSNQNTSLFYSKTLYVAASLIPTTLYYFTLVFLQSEKKHIRSLIWLISANILIIYLSVFTDKIVKATFVTQENRHIFYLGDLYYVYVIYILVIFLASFIRLFSFYFKNKNEPKRELVLYIAIGYTLSGIIGCLSNLILPWFNNLTLNPYGPLGTIFVAITISYALTKKRLFNIKVISAEIFITILWIFASVKLVVIDNAKLSFSNLVFNLAVFLMGLLLIINVRKEVEQKEKIKAQADQLQELDELKSEFISLATHHISSPLTAIKGYISIIEESDQNEPIAKHLQSLNVVQRLTNNTVNLVKDFIDVNKIDDKKTKYEFSEFYIGELINQIITEYEPQIQRRGIKFTAENVIDQKILINADKEKIRHALINILENSIKYTDNGYIKLTASKETNFFLIKLTDNGIRNLPTISPRLLRKLTQSGNTDEANIIGNGIGVYAAKLLIEGNKGKLIVESTDNTTSFIIQLPNV